MRSPEDAGRGISVCRTVIDESIVAIEGREKRPLALLILDPSFLEPLPCPELTRCAVVDLSYVQRQGRKYRAIDQNRAQGGVAGLRDSRNSCTNTCISSFVNQASGGGEAGSDGRQCWEFHSRKYVSQRSGVLLTGSVTQSLRAV